MKNTQNRILAGIYRADISNGLEVSRLCMRLRRYAAKHSRTCEMECNGEGYIRGKFWRLDNKAAYSTDSGGTEYNVFDTEIERIEARIIELVKASGLPVSVDFQHDPRGYTVRLNVESRDITNIALS